ncbi:MAG TPA: arsenic-transporting ATPase [Terrisporobacter glycolicus]|uniref:ArsA family ATPase n=1 Tax=Terrisporobacter TaxID=1505652 RepID=UPI000E9A82D2|nr:MULTISPECIES: ArsA family ATPase [Terrisporobacter]MBN9646149.1 ArsA family ATPase [Terrisporobacter glycolicus]HBI94188.1 arsenic-transporting ATPase [Terrisporobacter hibernicus]
MRVILYTGKGGVGKTSVAAASACKIAKDGKKVLIISTDQAHSLADSFNMKLDKEPTKVNENLYAMEIDTVYEGEKSWANLKEYMKRLLTIKGEGSIEVEELLIFPGLEELFALFKILEIYDKNEYDILIVDCAPTGETLSLLKYPEMLSSFIKKVLPIKRKGAKIAGPAMEKVMKIPMPEDNVFDDIEYVMNKMERLQNLMLNKDIVSLRIVTTPEKIVINEAKRNFTCLHLYNYNVDAIIVNKIYPKEAMEGYFSKWIKMQDEGLKEIEEGFSEVPRYYLKLQKSEIRNIEVLKKVGGELFEDNDIAKVLFKKEIFTIEKRKESTTMKILLPFADKRELDLRQDKNEIVLSVKNETRRFPLPVNLYEKEITGAKFIDGYLLINF